MHNTGDLGTSFKCQTSTKDERCPMRHLRYTGLTRFDLLNDHVVCFKHNWESEVWTLLLQHLQFGGSLAYHARVWPKF